MFLPSYFGLYHRKLSRSAAANMAGNFFSFGPISGSRRAVTPGFLSQPDSTMYCDDLAVT